MDRVRQARVARILLIGSSDWERLRSGIKGQASSLSLRQDTSMVEEERGAVEQGPRVVLGAEGAGARRQRDLGGVLLQALQLLVVGAVVIDERALVGIAALLGRDVEDARDVVRR